MVPSQITCAWLISLLVSTFCISIFTSFDVLVHVPLVTIRLNLVVAVNPKPVINTIDDIISCNNATLNALAFSSMPASNVSYSWTNDNAAIGLAASGTGDLPAFVSTNNSNLPLKGNIKVTPVYFNQNLGCIGNDATFTITILPTVTVDPVQNQEVCTGTTIPAFTPVSNAGSLDGSSVTYSWNVSGSGINLANGSGNTIPAYDALNNGTTDLVATITVTPKYSYNGKSCDGTPVSYTITVKPAAPSANAGPDVVLCGAPAYTMKAAAVNTATGMWTQSGGEQVVIVDPSLHNTQITGLQPGNTYQFVWTVTSSGVCSSNQDIVVITTRSEMTQANAGNDLTICDFEGSGSTTLNGNLDATRNYETGIWSIISRPAGSTASLTNTADPQATLSFNKAGIYKLQWSIANDAGCEPNKDEILISVYDKVIAGTLNGNTEVCAGSDVTLNLANYRGEVYQWQYNPEPLSGGTWRDTTFTTATAVFANVQQTFAVRVIVRSPGFAEGCLSTATSNTITVNVAPGTNPGTISAASVVCKESNSGTVTLSGHTGAIVRWEYSEDGGINWTSINHTGNVLNYSGLLRTRWYRAVVQSGNCGALGSDHTIVTVMEPVTIANAGQDMRYCSVSSAMLQANDPGNGEAGLWTQLSGNPVAFSSSTIANPQITNLQPGTYVFEWKLSNGVCADTKDVVTITVDPEPLNNIETAPITICFGQTVSVPGLHPLSDNDQYQYIWQMSADGNNWTNIPGQTSVNLVFVPQQSAHVRRLILSASCSKESLPAFINVQPLLTSNTISENQNICSNTAPSLLAGSQPEGANGSYQFQWQMSADNGASWTDIPGATAKDYAPPALMATTKYRRVVNSDLCSGPQSSVSNAITVTIAPAAKAVFTQSQDTACAPFVINATTIQLQQFDDRNSSYQWYANGQLIGTGTNFPGYTINKDEDSVAIKLEAISKFGCITDTMRHVFYTYVNPKPSFTVSGTEGCGPLSIEVTNTTASTSLFTYKWDFGNGQTSDLAQPGSVIFQPNPAFRDTTYTITLWAYAACDTVMVTKEITVKAKPKAAFAPSLTVGCSPMPVIFTNTSLGIGNQYTWDFGDGTSFVTSSTDTFTHVYHTGVHTTLHAQLKAENECGADFAQYDLIISPNAVKLDFAVDGNEQNGCAPHTVHFRNNTIGASSFRWDFGDGTIANTTQNIDIVTHTYLTPGTYQVELRALNGCSDTSSVETVNVYMTPKAAFSISEYTVCLGDTIQPANQSENATSYIWSFGNGTGSDLSQPKLVYKEPGTYTLQLNALSASESGNICMDSVKYDIQVVASQTGWFDVSDSVGYCAPFTVTFTNRNTPAKTINWDFGDGEVASGNTVTHTFSRAGNYKVKLTVTVPGGCTYITERTISVTGPDGTLTYDGGFVCNDAAVRFEVTATNTDSIRWDFGDGQTMVTDQRIVYHAYEYAGSYVPTVTLYKEDKCSFFIQGVDTIKVDKLNAGFTWAQEQVCGTTTLHFRDTSFANNGVSRVEWKFGDGTSAPGSTISHDYNASGDYIIQQVITSNSGCTDTLEQVVNIQVHAIPVVSIEAVTDGCTDKEITFNSTIQSPDSVSIIQWTTSHDVTGTNKQFIVSFDQSGTYNLKLIAGTIYGCFDTAVHDIQVSPSPKIRASEDMVLCKDNSVQLNVTGAETFVWQPQQGLDCFDCSNPVARPLITTPYIVKGTNGFGCSDFDTVVVTVIQPMDLVVSGNDSICLGTSTQLLASGADRYQWSPASGLSATDVSNPVAAPGLTTNYRVIGYDEHHCFTDTAYVLVAVGNQPQISLGPDQLMSTGTLHSFKPVIQNGPIKKWTWSPGEDMNCSDCPDPVLNVKRDGAYTVTVTSNYNCTASDTMIIKTFCESSQVYVPNAFTPDGDGINDVMMVRAKGILSVKAFHIYNRWGELVFERSNFAPNDPAYGWDGRVKGKVGAPEVYIYTAEVMCENGATFTYKGNISLLR